VVTLTTTNVQLQEQLAAANAALEPLNARIAESESQVAPLTTTKTQLQGDLRVAQEALVLLNEKVTQSHLDRETAVLANNACVARYSTDMERGNGAIVAVDILKAKLRIEQKGVEHMGILLEKMISHHAFHKRKSHQSSRSALVIHESMRYELSCMSSHVDDVAFCAKNAAERRACGQGGLSCE
jgi:chromosome segregation ATPase